MPYLKRRIGYFASIAVFVLAVGALASSTAVACGYHSPAMIAKGVLNLVFPKSLYVGTAVWQAEMSGLLPPRPQEKRVRDFLELSRVSRDLQHFGVRLSERHDGEISDLPDLSLVLIDSVLWTRFIPRTDMIHVEVHARGPATESVVLATHSKVLKALVRGTLSAKTARASGLVRYYGDAAQISNFESRFEVSFADGR